MEREYDHSHVNSNILSCLSTWAHNKQQNCLSNRKQTSACTLLYLYKCIRTMPEKTTFVCMHYIVYLIHCFVYYIIYIYLIYIKNKSNASHGGKWSLPNILQLNERMAPPCERNTSMQIDENSVGSRVVRPGTKCILTYETIPFSTCPNGIADYTVSSHWSHPLGRIDA